MIFAQNGDVRLSCRESGLEAGSPATLMIHGMNANMAFWHPLLVRNLGALRRLLMYDQRGHGYSDLPSSGYTSVELASDAVAILDTFDESVVDVVAHSYGATVAIQFACSYPERTRSLTILDGHVRQLQPTVRLRDWTQFERWQEHFANAGVHLDPNLELDFETPLQIADEAWNKARQGLTADGFFAPTRSKKATAKYRRLLKETSAAKELRSEDGFTIADLKKIATPTLAIYGSYSPYLPTRDALLKEIVQCRSKSLPDVGHNFPILCPAETTEPLLQFWADVDAGEIVS